MKILRVCLLLSAWLSASMLHAQDTKRVVVMTSYQQELISRYETAFEAAHPDIDLVFEWRRSEDARRLMKTPEGAAVDVYWAPTLDTFVSMAQQGLFTTLKLPAAGLPGQIGKLVIDDPQQHFAAFEVAGFGFAYNQRYLDSKALPVPKDWQELTDSRYAGSLLMPVPSRQGFSPMIYQSIVQGLGWDAAWSLITAMAGNAELMGNGGGAFIDEIAAGRVGLALTIDFFPKSALANGAPVKFRYAETTLFSPAYVAQMKAAPHPQNAAVFMDFVMSDAGQGLLLHRDVARLPVRPSAYPKDADYNPFKQGAKVPSFNFAQAGAHQRLLSAVFDVQITSRHKELVAALAQLRKAEAAAGTNADARERVARARNLLLAAPIDAAAAAMLLGSMTGAQEGTPPDPLPVQAWTQVLNERKQTALALIEAVLTAGR